MECGNRHALGKVAREVAWRFRGYDGEAREDSARHEATREGIKAVRSEKKGHVKEMPVGLSRWSTAYMFQKYRWYEQRRKFHVAEAG